MPYDALVFCDDNDDGYDCSDDDTHDDNACSVHAHDDKHENDALEASEDGVLHDESFPEED